MKRAPLLAVLALIGACRRDDAPLRATLGADPTSSLRVRLLRSADRGATWSIDMAPLAHGVSSLHACTFEGEVWVPGLVDRRTIPWWETAFPLPFVDSFRSFDLATWGAHRIPLEGDTTGGVDPACVVGPKGLEMWFAETEGIDNDPAQGNLVAKIWRSHWIGGRWGNSEVVYSGRGLVDPAPIYIDGALRLFLNHNGHHIVELVNGQIVDRWENATVPHAVDLGDRRWLVAQAPRNGAMLPFAREILPESLGPPFPINIDSLLRTCESPSMTTLGPTWLLFCVQTDGQRQ